MARQRSKPAPAPSASRSRAGRTSRPAKPSPRKARLGSVVSAIASRARSVAQRAKRSVAKRPRRAQPADPPARGGRSIGRAPQETPKLRATPVRRVSVVRKPARGPSVHAARPAAPRRAEPIPKTSLIAPPPAASAPARAGSPAAVRHEPALQAAQPAAALRPTPAEGPESRFSIPTHYGEDRLVLMVKDPWWIFAYWEIQPGTERAARSQLLPHEVPGLQSVLRVYDVTGIDDPAQPPHRHSDIALSGLATNWYIHVNTPDRSFIVELGLLAHTGRFILLARSNRVTTPRFGPSDLCDEAWCSSDEVFEKLMGDLLTSGRGTSPGDWARFAAQGMSSGQWSSTAGAAHHRAPSMVKGFWCRINTDLIIHGATEPRAAVSVQGHPVLVRRDGTFSLRLALPEGTQTVTVDVTSPDGRQASSVTPVVTLAWSGTLAAPGASGHAPLLNRQPELRRSV